MGAEDVTDSGYCEGLQRVRSYLVLGELGLHGSALLIHLEFSRLWWGE